MVTNLFRGDRNIFNEIFSKVYMQKKLLKKIIPDFAGAGSEKLVDLLYEKQNVNEFLIAKKLDMTINQTRNMLYKLADEGLVGFVRKKDKKKGGWYTYFWTLKVKRSLFRFKEKIMKDVEGLRHQLNSREVGRYFHCKNCEVEYNEENAMLNEYTCQECGEVLEMKETDEFVEQTKEKIRKLEGVVGEIDKEIGILETKEQKSRDRRLKAELKKKEIERAKRRKERAKEREKEMKKAGRPVRRKKTKVKKKPRPPVRKKKKKTRPPTRGKKAKKKAGKKFSKKRKKR